VITTPIPRSACVAWDSFRFSPSRLVHTLTIFDEEYKSRSSYFRTSLSLVYSQLRSSLGAINHVCDVAVNKMNCTAYQCHNVAGVATRSAHTSYRQLATHTSLDTDLRVGGAEVCTRRHREYSNDLVAVTCNWSVRLSSGRFSDDTVASSVLCEIPTDVESSVFIP
jgi:hypothetical protein